MGRIRKNMTREQHFWARVDKTPGHGPQGDCWAWTAYCDPHGYGRCNLFPGVITAHRTAHLFAIGSIPDGLDVCHACDFRKCCNPSHFFLGSHTQNNEDRDAKGRQRAVRGSDQGQSRLTEELVLQLRSEFISTGKPRGFQSDKAREYGVHVGTIHLAVHGKSWGHL